MVKPILRLGPGHEPDEDYDPLLGRTVREEPVANTPAFTPPLAADKSIFDDPEPELDAEVLPTLPLTKPNPPTSAAHLNQPSLLDWMEKLSPAGQPTSKADKVAVVPDTALDAQTEQLSSPRAESPVEDIQPETAWQPEAETLQEEALAAPADIATAENTPSPDAGEPLEDRLEPIMPAPEHEAQASLTSGPAPWDLDWKDPDAPGPSSSNPEAVDDVPPLGPVKPTPFWQEMGSGAATRTERPRGEAPITKRRAGMRRSAIGRRKHLQRVVARGAGVTFFVIALFFTLISYAAPIGYPFDAASGFRWYWTLCAVLATISWAGIRAHKMMLASGLLTLLNLLVIVPALGKAPVGGGISTAVVGWANVGGTPEALTKVLAEAERRKANLVLVGEAPSDVQKLATGWRVIQAPVAGDATSIAVLTRGRWQSATIPGEPTMVRTEAGDLTILATRPPPSRGQAGVQAAREAQLNRAAVRAGDQDGPVVVMGDFGVAPWDGAMQQFQEYSHVSRVRCGGLMGNTVNRGLGLIGVAHDHAYVRDVKVTHCKLGTPLPGSHHRAIYLYLAPLEQESLR